VRFVMAVLAALIISGCGTDDWSEPHPRPVAVGTLGDGFIDRAHPPAPEATITPRPGSWAGVHPSKDYRVVLLSSGTDAPTRTLVKAVREWADAEDVSLKTVTAERPSQYIPSIVEAMNLRPDLIISAGNALIDPLTVVSASHLDRQFLVLGAELAEPTANVTAAIWNGASFRGEGLQSRTGYDPSSFTAERAAEAVRAGVAAVLNGITGIVVHLD
jgi:hypothetical protein